MVLCDEILNGGVGGVKVNGLGELVTNAQVKNGFVRAIAMVHPDKRCGRESFFCHLFIFSLLKYMFCFNRQFNSSNSTVEQRMLANSVLLL